MRSGLTAASHRPAAPGSDLRPLIVTADYRWIESHAWMDFGENGSAPSVRCSHRRSRAGRLRGGRSRHPVRALRYALLTPWARLLHESPAQRDRPQGFDCACSEHRSGLPSTCPMARLSSRVGRLATPPRLTSLITQSIGYTKCYKNGFPCSF
jgi:hypothetical protein